MKFSTSSSSKSVRDLVKQIMLSRFWPNTLATWDDPWNVNPVGWANPLDFGYLTAFPDLTVDVPSFRPRMDVQEREKDYFIRTELPGLEKGDIKIQYTNNGLELSGKKTREREEHG
eukprot:TRINITY_DN10604_c0_g1_i2.p1 TRINITY_DN10604_c0_g1~~TRINITY_DN10604_c0_g1_i2.p1  ORF type:complete len:116 (+),score=21.27 TRINITY_DN10604_c0_g1_i2:31-378(+)